MNRFHENNISKNESMIPDNEQCFMTLLSRIAHEGCEETNDDKILSKNQSISWSELLTLADKHNVYPLIYKIACKDPAFKALQEFSTYSQFAIWQVAIQALRTEAFSKLYKSFIEADLHPIVMKGIICRQLYGKYCNHRPSSDEDILVKPSDFNKIKYVLLENGYKIERENITEWDLKELQEITFYGQGLNVEVHVNPIGHETSYRRKLNDYFKDVFGRTQELEINSVKYTTMSHTDHYLFLILHSLKHLTTTGFGIRQVLDILLYRERYKEFIDWKFLEEVLQQVEARSFYIDLISIGSQYMAFEGIDRCEQQFGWKNISTSCPDLLLEDIMQNGVFGNSTSAQRTSVHMVTAAMDNHSKFKIYLETAFPSMELMKFHHPELVQKPWLLPIRWAQRWQRYIKRGMNFKKETQIIDKDENQKRSGSLMKESIVIGQRRIDLLKKYNLIKK